MKTIIYPILIFLALSCGQSKIKNPDKDNTLAQKDSIQIHFMDSMDFTINERKLICGNKTYYNKTTPFIEAVSKNYAARILLYDSKDTILVKSVNIDTLINAIIKDDVKADSISVSILKEYNIVDIIPTSGIRGCNTYLIAKLLKDDSKDIFIRFAIKTFGDNVSHKGRLWVNGYSYDDRSYGHHKEEMKKVRKVQ